MTNSDKIESILKRYKPCELPEGLKKKIFCRRETRYFHIWASIAAGIFIIIGTGITWKIYSENNIKNDERKINQVNKSVTQAGKISQLSAIANLFSQVPDGENHAEDIRNEIRLLSLNTNINNYEY
ncbi:MAG: hypothetical protein JXA96_09755 [Sedimentisphaerales bacterium]|nr:hypothetical protein [Sedimentisphaerales bacterium]